MKSKLLIFSVWVSIIYAGSVISCSSESLQTPEMDLESSYWSIPSGGNLRIVLKNWAIASGWNLLWEVPTDYHTQIAVTLKGSFEEAIHELMASINRTNPNIQALFYRKNKVLVVLSHDLLG